MDVLAGAAEPLPDEPADHLAHRALGQRLGGKLDLGGPLDSPDLLTGSVNELLLGGLLLLAKYDYGEHGLAPLLVRHADDRDLLDRRM